MQNSLIKELKSLYTGEGFSSVMFFFIWLYCCFEQEYQELARSLHIALPLVTLCFILAIGAYFWKLMYDIVKTGGKMYMTSKQQRLFILFKRVSIVLIIICSMLFIYALITGEQYLMLSAFLLCFAIVEYINYFHIRLSYLTPREFGALLKHKRLRRSHLNRVMYEEVID